MYISVWFIGVDIIPIDEIQDIQDTSALCYANKDYICCVCNMKIQLINSYSIIYLI